MGDQEAATVARNFHHHWIARFGTSLRVTTDQGRQFESHLFKELNALTGTTHLRTTAYHPEANGMVERFHRQLKAAIKCHHSAKWIETLPTLILEIRSAWKEDLQSTAAEMVYGEPGEFLGKAEQEATTTSDFVQKLRQYVRQLQPVHGTRHGERTPFVFKHLATASQVFVRHDEPKGPLQQPYDGPFKVVSRAEKVFVVCVRGQNIKILINRLKPADLDDINTNNERTTEVQLIPIIPEHQATQEHHQSRNHQSCNHRHKEQRDQDAAFS
ncbi:uncharacterized protein LOC108736974 [Agrilus planipennis]|uniref:Uncharacterized protein LOC108736974 n=1 Tax=Agrilus planipennis TaxID=224129 RepID=A0A1W4WY77_AGRPL|nr:uncharacterized protein LOC108736974 [Agrilus planipennis]